MATTCLACRVAFKVGDRVLPDVSGDYLHAACCGPEREGYVKDVETGEPLGPNDPIPAGFVWSAADEADGDDEPYTGGLH